MIKKFIPFFVILSLVALIVTIFLSVASQKEMIVIKEGNAEKVPLEMVVNKYQDSDCGMLIDNMDYISQVISPTGKTWFFHDHGGFVKWLEDKEFRDSSVVWVMSKDTKKWIDGRTASYSLVDKTPMGYGFGAYENKVSTHVDFDTMRLRMLRGETLNNPHIRKQLLGH
jgi:copper chaperone NosL